MNLLIDPWIPVACEPGIERIRFQDVLCTDTPWQIQLPRDDMQMACLQMLVCLTQSLFKPKDRAELLRNADGPMSEEDYATVAKPFLDWFELFHPETPFMQVRGVKAKAPTPIQKLFPGLPEGNNHALFNEPGESQHVCPSCAAIALFNQASDAPSMGGGFKEGLRGGSPVTLMVRHGELRETLWANVLHGHFLDAVAFPDPKEDVPNWVKPLKRDVTIPASSIGMTSGLFWQPAHYLLQVVDADGCCDACGLDMGHGVDGFLKEKFTYTIEGTWPHPHSSRTWRVVKGEQRIKFSTFNSDAPAWSQLPEFVVEHTDEKKEGSIPALTLQQYRDLYPGRQLVLSVGGYRNKQAAILERRHETMTLRQGWEDNLGQIDEVFNHALAIKDHPPNKVYGFGKSVGVEGLPGKDEAMFYRQSEPLIHRRLQSMDFGHFVEELDRQNVRLAAVARSIFEELASPYSHTPRGLQSLATTRRTLNAALSKLKKGA